MGNSNAKPTDTFVFKCKKGGKDQGGLNATYSTGTQDKRTITLKFYKTDVETKDNPVTSWKKMHIKVNGSETYLDEFANEGNVEVRFHDDNGLLFADNKIRIYYNVDKTHRAIMELKCSDKKFVFQDKIKGLERVKHAMLPEDRSQLFKKASKKTEEPKVEEQKVAQPEPESEPVPEPVPEPEPVPKEPVQALELEPKQPTEEELEHERKRKIREEEEFAKKLREQQNRELASRLAIACKMEKEVREGKDVVTILEPEGAADPQDAKVEHDEPNELRRLAANDSMDTVFTMLWILPLLVILVFWFKRYIVTSKNNDGNETVEDNANGAENDLNNIV